MLGRRKILCVGNDPDLLKRRCTALGQSGHYARTATAIEAEILLLVEQFDFVILSSGLSKDDSARVLAVAGATKTLALDGVAFPADLLKGIERILATG
jgi:DNA-binding response OmpR family regulator